LGYKISLLWIDTQGYEGFVIKGALQEIQRERFPICLEFWPFGLERSGCLQLLIELMSLHYQGFYDLHEQVEVFRPIGDLRSFVAQYAGEFRHTDLLFL
jgi:hypothetical protein